MYSVMWQMMKRYPAMRCGTCASEMTKKEFFSGCGGLWELINPRSHILALSLNSAFVYILITINSCNLLHNTQQVRTYILAKPAPCAHVCPCLHIDSLLCAPPHTPRIPKIHLRSQRFYNTRLRVIGLLAACHLWTKAIVSEPWDSSKYVSLDGICIGFEWAYVSS